MATLLKRRRIANPGKRRKKLSAKQIRFFGTARQKAALKNSSKRKRTKTYKPKAKRRVSNPVRRKRRLRNVGKIVTLGLRKNPGKKRRKVSMAKIVRKRRKSVANPAKRRRRTVRKAVVRRKRRTVNAGTTRRRRRSVRRNPGMRSYRRRSYRRNPGITEWEGMAKDALAVIGGAVGSKYLTQLVLAGNNVSYMGYLGNAIATGVLGFATSHLLKNKRLSHMIMLGGATALALRVLQDMTPLGQYVNLSLNGMGKGGDIGLGAIEDSSFTTPVTWPAGKMSGMAQVPNYIMAAIPPAAAASPGMKGLGSTNRNARRTRGRV